MKQNFTAKPMRRDHDRRSSAKVVGVAAASAWAQVAAAFDQNPSASSFRRRVLSKVFPGGSVLVFASLGLVLVCMAGVAQWRLHDQLSPQMAEDMPVALAVLGVGCWCWAGLASRLGGATARYQGRTAREAILAFRARHDPELLPPQVRSWGYGALGEEAVAAELASLGPEYQVAHDVLIFDGHGIEKANIDHVVTGPFGTVMIDAKYWSGTVVPNDHGDSLWRTGVGGEGLDVTERAVDSLSYEAGCIPGGTVAIIVAVVGKGSVSGGQVVLPRTNYRSELIAVHVDDLVATVHELAAHSRGRTRSVRKLLAASGGVLQLSTR